MANPLEGAAAKRRSVLGLVGLGAVAVAGGGTLAGCSEKTGGEGTSIDQDKLNAVLPKHIPFDGVKPDVPGTPPVADGYRNYPSSLVQAISEPPGKGSTITTMTPYWGPVPPGPGSNKYLDGINKSLNVTLTPNVQDGNTYVDKLNASMGARDVPDVLVIPSWNVNGITNFGSAATALFEDLTPFLSGDKAAAYPMLANIPTLAWKHAVWNDKLSAVPWPSGGPFPWALFYRADLVTEALPKTADELHAFGKAITDPSKGVWAFNNIQAMVEMMFRSPGSQEGWRKKDGNLQFKYETEEFRAALEFMAKLFADGLVHPDVVASDGADSKQLFAGGKILMIQDGPGAWQGMQTEQQKVLSTYKMLPVPAFAADGGTPLFHSSGGGPVFYSFIKKGLGAERTEEILRVLNYVASPLGTKEYEQIVFGIEGEHFTRGDGGWPVGTDLAGKEIAEQVRFLAAYIEPVKYTAEIPWYFEENLKWQNETVKYLEPNPFDGMKIEMPEKFTKIRQPTEDKITDLVRGRRPFSDLDGIITEWRNTGGDEAREFLNSALAAVGR